MKTLYKSQNRMELLSRQTGAELACQKILSSLGVEYVVQKPISTGRRIYYADIYVPKLRLCIEIDGAYHFTDNQKRLDTNRSAGIRRLGYHLCRLTNADARNPKKVLSKIARYEAKKT